MQLALAYVAPEHVTRDLAIQLRTFAAPWFLRLSCETGMWCRL